MQKASICFSDDVILGKLVEALRPGLYDELDEATLTADMALACRPVKTRSPALVGLKENQRINPLQSKLPRQRVSHRRLRCMLAQPCIRH